MTDIARITVDEVQQRLARGERLVYIDSRSPQAWASAPTKLPGAIRVPADDVQARLDAIPRDARLVTYCT